MKLLNTPEFSGERKPEIELDGKIWGNPLFDTKLKKDS